MEKHELSAEDEQLLDEISKFMRKNVRGPFKPFAHYTYGLRDFRVIRKDCSYVAKRVSPWAEIHIDTHCPWYRFWQKYTGFTLYFPPELDVTGEIPVIAALDRVLQKDPRAFGKHRRRFYRLARGLMVRIPTREEIDADHERLIREAMQYCGNDGAIIW